MARRYAASLLAVLVLGVSVSACGAKSTPAAAGTDTINLGAVLALTGPSAFVGTTAKNGMLLAQDAVNNSGAAGSGRQLAVDIQDSQSLPAQAAGLIRQFAGNSSNVAVLGPSSSPEAIAAGPVATAAKIPMLVYAANSAKIVDGGAYVFDQTSLEANAVQALVAPAKATHVTKMAVLYQSDNQAGLDAAKAAGAIFGAAGMTVSTEGVLSTTTDYAGVVTKFVSQGIDGVYIVNSAEPSASFATQARSGGLKAQLFGAKPVAAANYIKNAGPAAEGTIIATDYFVNNTTAQNKDFVAAYKARFNAAPDNFAALGYASVMLMATVIKTIQGKVTRDGIIGALGAVKGVPTIFGTGSYSMDSARRGAYDSVVVVARSGDFTLWQS